MTGTDQKLHGAQKGGSDSNHNSVEGYTPHGLQVDCMTGERHRVPLQSSSDRGSKVGDEGEGGDKCGVDAGGEEREEKIE